MDGWLPPGAPSLFGLAAALAGGLVIGLERGWSQRVVEEGQRVAGLRTFTLIGLVGGVLGQLGGDLALAAGLLGLGALLGLGYLTSDRPRDHGITTEIAAMATLLLGALATRGQPEVAVGLAVVVAALLEAKAPLHRFLRRLVEGELVAGLKLAVLAAVVLPILPDVDVGPGKLLNPRSLGAIVVALAAVSYLGYWLLKLFGARVGPLLFGLAGGLVSSTTLTLSAARISRRDPGLARPLAVSAGVANAVMLVRMLVVAVVLAPELAQRLLPAFAAALAASVAAIAVLWWRGTGDGLPKNVADHIEAPVPVGESVLMALLVTGVAAAAGLARDAFTDRGIVAVAAIAGLADVDAVTITASRLAASEGEAILTTAGLAVATAAAVNLAAKSGLAFIVGGTGYGTAATVALAVTGVAGAAALAVTGL